MKKIIYITLLMMVCSIAFSSCTEEEVAPNTTELNGGGNGTGDPLK